MQQLCARAAGAADQDRTETCIVDDAEQELGAGRRERLHHVAGQFVARTLNRRSSSHQLPRRRRPDPQG